MSTATQLTQRVKETAKRAGADLVGVASIDRFDHAPDDMHPRGIFSHTQSVIAIGCRMVRGALKTVEEGQYWQAYNCDSYQFINEILAPQILRTIGNVLEDHGYTAVPLHNPFGFARGRAVRPGGTKPDGKVSLRMVGVAAGLGELGRSKMFLTPEFGPRQRMYAVYTDAKLDADPVFTGKVCDDCGACSRACPADAIPEQRSIKWRVGEREFSHADLDCPSCSHVHQGWDPRYSPFVDPDGKHDRENPPAYFQFVDRRFRHRSICVGRGCIRACMDHLEKSGRLSMQYHTPMIEGRQWVIEDDTTQSTR